MPRGTVCGFHKLIVSDGVNQEQSCPCPASQKKKKSLFPYSFHFAHGFGRDVVLSSSTSSGPGPFGPSGLSAQLCCLNKILGVRARKELGCRKASGVL